MGTSASELLHFVKIPPDSLDKSARPIFILASRLAPAFFGPLGPAPGSRPGIHQILQSEALKRQFRIWLTQRRDDAAITVNGL